MNIPDNFKEFLYNCLRSTSFRDYCEVPYFEVLSRPRYLFIKKELEAIETAILQELRKTND